jgi:phosphoglycolate phosphatase-like HAD superfamily hydrolase
VYSTASDSRPILFSGTFKTTMTLCRKLPRRQLMSGTASAAVIIGDSANDMLCARASAVTAILIPSDYGNPAEDANVKLTRFAELPEALAQT